MKDEKLKRCKVGKSPEESLKIKTKPCKKSCRVGINKLNYKVMKIVLEFGKIAFDGIKK